MKKVIIIIVTILLIIFGGGAFWHYALADFEIRLNDVVILLNEPVSEIDFINEYNESLRGITVGFAEGQSLSFPSGKHTVELEFTRGLRTKTNTATLYVAEPVEQITIEFAEPDIYLEPMDFILNDDILWDADFYLDFIYDFPVLEELPVGQKIIELRLNYSMFSSIINVVDTIAPVAVTQDIELLMGEEFTPEDFIVEIYDESPVSEISFLNEPVITGSGEHNLKIVVADIHGNSAVFEAYLFITPNDIPPTIEGAESFEVVKDAPIRFREGVTAVDAFGRPLEIGVNSGAFDASEPGLYDIVYYAEDAWGLRAETKISVRVIEVEPDYVRSLVDDILAGILREDMTQVEQARAIFNWISWSMSTAPDILRESVFEAALNGLQTRRGNCYTYYAMSEVFLTQAGIPNMMIERKPGTPTRHRWNLINPDNLGWHHFDAMPTRVGSAINRFMFKSSQIPEYNQLLQAAESPADYYTYVPELYPEIVN
jgi:hypothetical protein